MHQICQMPILTLTTDYGLKDFYVSALKAKLYTAFPEISCVDISHLIPPFDLVQGSLVFKSAWKYFPKNTIHIIDIDNAEGNPYLLLFEMEEQYFIMPDNGMISLIFDKTFPGKIFKLEYAKDSLVGVQIYDLFIKAVQIIRNQFAGSTPSANYMQSLTFQPTYTSDSIHASVIYIDHYHNLILNLESDLFNKIRNGRNFEIVIKRHTITEIHSSFHEVKENEICCFFNASGHLTIGINKSNAAALLGLGIGNEILIYFSN